MTLPPANAPILPLPSVATTGLPSPTKTPRPPARWSTRKRLLLSLALLAVLVTGVAASWKFLLGPGRSRPDLIIHEVKRETLIQTIVEKGELQAAKNHDVNCTVNHEALCAAKTTIKQVVEDGTPVRKGDRLMVLDDSRLQDLLRTQGITRDKAENDYIYAKANLQIVSKQGATDVETKQRAVELAEKNLEKYEKGDYPQALSKANGDIEIARGELEQYRDNAAFAERLVKK